MSTTCHHKNIVKDEGITTNDAPESEKELNLEAQSALAAAPSAVLGSTGPDKDGITGDDAEKEAGSTPKKDETPEFSSFGPWEKKFIVLIASIGASFSPFTTNIYFPALNDMATDLSVSITQINLTITTYMIFQGIAPSFIGNYADSGGRRPAYVIGFLIYLASNIGLALNNSYVGLMILRCVQSAGSSGMVALRTAIVADIVTSAERGSYVAFTSVGSILAPSIAPVAGGLISQHLGWHWIFWLLVIISAVFFIPLLAFFPETCRRIVGDGSIPPPKWNRSLLNVIDERRRRKADVEKRQISEDDHAYSMHRRFPNPFDTFKLMAEKETAIVLAFGSLIYAGFYSITTTITTQFHAIYHLSSTDTGLLFLPVAIGSICAALTNGMFLDANYRRHAKRAGISVDKKRQVDLTGFPIERARLEFGIPMFCIGALAMIVYGWLLEFKVSMAGPIVFLFIIAYTGVAGFSVMMVLIIDIHRHRAATASAASNLTRCLLGAGASAVVNPMIEAMGLGWCFTFIGLVWLATLPMLWTVIKWGPQWRQELAEKEKGKKAREDERRRSGADAIIKVPA